LLMCLIDRFSVPLIARIIWLRHLWRRPSAPSSRTVKCKKPGLNTNISDTMLSESERYLRTSKGAFVTINPLKVQQKRCGFRQIEDHRQTTVILPIPARRRLC
jgi:hypothetical protein